MPFDAPVITHTSSDNAMMPSRRDLKSPADSLEQSHHCFSTLICAQLHKMQHCITLGSPAQIWRGGRGGDDAWSRAAQDERHSNKMWRENGFTACLKPMWSHKPNLSRHNCWLQVLWKSESVSWSHWQREGCRKNAYAASKISDQYFAGHINARFPRNIKWSNSSSQRRSQSFRSRNSLAR